MARLLSKCFNWKNRFSYIWNVSNGVGGNDYLLPFGNVSASEAFEAFLASKLRLAEQEQTKQTNFFFLSHTAKGPKLMQIRNVMKNVSSDSSFPSSSIWNKAQKLSQSLYK